MRKLASIKTITELLPIDGRDKIELAIVDGWSVIIKKGEFKIGDKCIYVEIDSVMPDRPEFDFLRGKNFRIKTMKMAGVISQGICFPMSLLGKDYPIGADVTAELGIVQYEVTRDIERVSNSGKRPPIKHYPKWLMRYEWFRQYIYKKDRRGAKEATARLWEVKTVSDTDAEEHERGRVDVTFSISDGRIDSSDKTIVISGEDIFIDPRCVNQEFKKTILQNTKSSRLSIKMIPQTFVNNNDYD